MNLSNLFKNANNVVEFLAGETIFSAGEHGEIMYVVLEGEVDVQVNDSVVDVIKTGNIFGEMALIDAGPRSATAIAKSDLPARFGTFPFRRIALNASNVVSQGDVFDAEL